MRWAILAVVLLTDVMDLLDTTVMNVAGPSVRDGLGGGETTIQWLSAGYTLAFGVFLVVGGRLGDRWGRRRMFVVGAAGFTAASAVCALASSPAVLITARVVQGAFGALLIPQGLGVLTEVFVDERERGRAFGLFGPVTGLAAVGGPILAGVLVGLPGLGWRWAFLINLPLGLATVIGALAWMPRDRPDPGARLDVVGAVLVAMGSALLIHPLVQGREAGWPWWTAAELLGALVAFALLAGRQRRAPAPILVPSLLGNRVFVAGLAAAVVFNVGFGGLLLVLSLHVQLGDGASPLIGGLALAPVAAGIAAGSVVAPGLTERLGRGVLHLGLAVEAVGAVGLAAAALTGDRWPALGGAALVLGLGMGLVFGPLIQTVLSGAAPHEVGSASGVLNAVRQIAVALGVAVLGTVFFALDAGPSGFAAAALAVAALAIPCALLVLLLPRRLTGAVSATDDGETAPTDSGRERGSETVVGGAHR